ncbi:MAG: DUF4234 domain-containing protein [Bacillota bacterium]|nr:DUF4234 domain-containing protein [Bacillota bacterium]
MKGTVRSPIMVLLLSLITCEIYMFFWIYTVSKEMKEYRNDTNINPTVELLLCIFTCGIYTIYWYYKYSKMVYEAGQALNLQMSDNSIVCLILPIFGLSIVSALILQSSLNTLWGAPNVQ